MPQKKPPNFRPRLVPRDGEIKIVRKGHDRLIFRDLYVNLLTLPWWSILLLGAAFYMISNLAFASVFYALGDDIENAHSFADMFFFSVQTMATIGYGHMAPNTISANIIVAFEALWGLSFFAFVTGLVFSKFSRPTAHVLFGDYAVISPFDGEPHLKIRLANQRTNRIVNAEARLYLIRSTVTKEGYPMRRFFDLGLVRNNVPLLQLSWTLLHLIDDASPLKAYTTEDMRKNGDEIVVTLTGLDETLSQTVHARHSYVADEIKPDAFFEDVLTQKDGHVFVNYHLFHEIRDAPNPQRDNIRF